MTDESAEHYDGVPQSGLPERTTGAPRIARGETIAELAEGTPLGTASA